MHVIVHHCIVGKMKENSTNYFGRPEMNTTWYFGTYPA